MNFWSAKNKMTTGMAASSAPAVKGPQFSEYWLAMKPWRPTDRVFVEGVWIKALAMMNSPLVRGQAEKLAERIRPKNDEPIEASIDRGYEFALGRKASADERRQMVAFVKSQRAAFGDDKPSALAQAFTEFCHVLLCLNEFVYVD